MSRTRALGPIAVVVLALAAAEARAEATPSAPPSAVPALALGPGKPVEIACTTKSVVVATGAANATSGNLTLKLELAAADGPAKGTWSILSVSPTHRGSLATLQAETCAKGCPLALGETDVQLWAPAPKGVVELGADELLMLAVLKTASLELKVSTFRGQQIEALESGTCEVVPGASPPPPGSEPAGKPNPDAG